MHCETFLVPIWAALAGSSPPLCARLDESRLSSPPAAAPIRRGDHPQSGHPEGGGRNPLGSPKTVESKPWLEVDETLPAVQGIRPRKVKLTLFPYTANTPYNWDPVRQRKIKVDKNTWRNDPFYELKTMTVYSNWAKSPIDAGPRESLEQIEATGLRYQVLGRVANQSVLGWQAISRPSGYSLMPDKGAWNIRARKRRARTLEVLRMYADSTRIEPKQPVSSKEEQKR